MSQGIVGKSPRAPLVGGGLGRIALLIHAQQIAQHVIAVLGDIGQIQIDIPGPVAGVPEDKIVLASSREVARCRLAAYPGVEHQKYAIAAAYRVPGAIAGPPHGVVGLTIAIKIAGNRRVAFQSPLLGDHRAIAAANDVPGAVARPPHGHLGLAVAVIIGRHGNVAVHSPPLNHLHPVAAAGYIPGATARSPHGVVGLAVAVIVAGHGNVAVHAVLLHNMNAIAAAHDVPLTVAGPPQGKVGLAIVIVIAGRRHIVFHAPLQGNDPAIAAANHVPDAVARPPDSKVGLAVAVIVAGNGDVARPTPLLHHRMAGRGWFLNLDQPAQSIGGQPPCPPSFVDGRYLVAAVVGAGHAPILFSDQGDAP